MAGGALRQAMLAAIRDNRERIKTPYDRCADAPLAVPQSVAIGPRGGTLVTRLHALHAAHYPLAAGATIRYQWGERRVVAVDTVPGTDIAIATLDAVVPDEVTPMRMLPHDWRYDLRTDRWGSHLRDPIVAHGTRADGSVHVVSVLAVGERFGAPGPWATGDSGQPVWLPLPEPILVGCHQYAGSGPTPHHHWLELTRRTLPEAMMEGRL